jgi:glycosyltransferase involved in cell wall biosynthesis
MKKTVLHIAGHMGQGIGKVLSGVACYKEGKFKHDIILLGDKIDTQFSDRCLENGVDVKYITDPGYIATTVAESDIVQYDWWHYPLLAKVMWDVRDIKMRMIIWSHVSGCYFPYLHPNFVTLPHKFVFTSLYSKDNSYWSLNDMAKMSTQVINSSGGFPNTENVPLEKHNGFNVGYLGTIKFIKLNPRFVDFCEECSCIPHIKFIMIGTVPEPNRILQQAKERGIDDLFEFKGHVPEVSTELAKLDVMGYILNPYSYVTSENAMLEGMSMGIPPICLYQGAEKYLVKNGKTGILVHDKTGYRVALETLYKDTKYRKELGQNAREYVLSNLNISNTVSKLDEVYTSVMRNPKRKFDIGASIGTSPYQWYHSGIPPVGINAVLPHLYDDSKSSVLQWQKYFPTVF